MGASLVILSTTQRYYHIFKLYVTVVTQHKKDIHRYIRHLYQRVSIIAHANVHVILNGEYVEIYAIRLVKIQPNLFNTEAIGQSWVCLLWGVRIIKEGRNYMTEFCFFFFL